MDMPADDQIISSAPPLNPSIVSASAPSLQAEKEIITVDEAAYNPVDPVRYMTKPELISQRMALILLLACLNGGLAVVAFLVPEPQRGYWVLAFIIFMKAKDVLYTLISMAGLSIRAVHEYFKPAEPIPPQWILSLIPGYAESEEQILRAIFALRDNDIGIHKQVMLVILDGKHRDVKSKMTNIVASWRRPYVNSKFKLGELIIDAGFCEDVPVILIEKVKNAGKKDSLILGHDLFNVQRENCSPLTKKLRADIFDVIMPALTKDAGLPFNGFDMIFCTDADSEIYKGALARLADAVARDPKVIAACGLVLVQLEKGQAWSFGNLYQQYQYNFGQFIRRQGESQYGKVTCLPGCVQMIAVRPEMAGAMRLYAEPVKTTSILRHQVQYLGTDRRLTYSMLAQGIGLKTVFVPSAISTTIAPQSVVHFFSQRRRWGSNAYFNNYFYAFGTAMHPLTRFFAFIEVLRLSVVYYRIINTALFIYGLTKHFHLAKIIPVLVVSQFPTVFFLVCVFCFHELRIRIHKLVIGWFLNKIFSPVVAVVNFTNVARKVGSAAWGMTGGSGANVQSAPRPAEEEKALGHEVPRDAISPDEEAGLAYGPGTPDTEEIVEMVRASRLTAQLEGDAE